MSSGSICLISLNAYHRMYPNSFFRRVLEAEDLEHARNSLVFHGFSKLVPLAKEKKDYLVILRLIEQDVDGVYDMLRTENIEMFRKNFEKMKSEIESGLLEKFEKFFAEEEKRI